MIDGFAINLMDIDGGLGAAPPHGPHSGIVVAEAWETATFPAPMFLRVQTLIGQQTCAPRDRRETVVGRAPNTINVGGKRTC